MRVKQLLSKKKKHKKQSFLPLLNILGKGVILYLVTIGQAVALAQQIRHASNQRLNAKRLGDSVDLPMKNNSLAPKHTHQPLKAPPLVLALPKNQLEDKFRECLQPYLAISPASVIIQMGIQVAPQQNGMRYERSAIKAKFFQHPNLSQLYRKRALSDPFYSLLLSKEYLRESSTYSLRLAEIFLFQAMLQANTSEEINSANRAYAELSTFDTPEDLRTSLFEYREMLISEYKLSHPGLCSEIQEGGAIYTSHSDPELFEFQAIVTKLDLEATQQFLNHHPKVQSKLALEATVKQNELASGTLALTRLQNKEYILGLALDIQRILQYRKSQFWIRLYQFAYRRLEQLLESPQINYRDVEMIAKISFLEPYFRDKTLTENEKIVFSKYSKTLELAQKRLRQQNLDRPHNWFSTYIASLFALLLTLMLFFNFRHKLYNKKVQPPQPVPHDKADREKASKPQKGSFKRRYLAAENLMTQSQENEDVSSEQKDALKKQKHIAYANKLKSFHEQVPDGILIKNDLTKKQSELVTQLTTLSEEAATLRSRQAKTKAEFDSIMLAEKHLDQQIRTKKIALTFCEKTLESIDAFILTVNEIKQVNHSIDDLDKLSFTIASLSETAEIVKKLKAQMIADLESKAELSREQHKTNLRMLEHIKSTAMRSVPPLVKQASLQLSYLQLIADDADEPQDYTDLENTCKDLVNGLSNLLELVNIDCKAMNSVEFDQHLRQVIEANNILNPNHPLQQAFVACLDITESKDQAPFL